MGQDPSQSYRHKELAKITGSLSHTLIVPLKSSDKHATQLQQELTPAQRRIMQLELEAQERQKGTDDVEQGTEEEINRLKETLAATTRQMEQIKEDYADRSDKATVCRAATGEGKSWLQGQQLQNKSPWNSLGWVKKRDQLPNTSARLLQRGILKLPRGTQARLWITPWAVKDMTCTDLTPAKQDRVTCSWTDTWAKGEKGGVETFTSALWRTLPHDKAKRTCCSQPQIVAQLGPKRPWQAHQKHWQIQPQRAK